MAVTGVQDIDCFECHLLKTRHVGGIRLCPVWAVAAVEIICVDVAIKPDW